MTTNVPDPTRHGLLLESERDELVAMLSSGRPWEEIDQRSRDLLLARDAMTAWEIQIRAASKTCFLFGGYRIFAPIANGETYGVYLGQHLFTGRVDALKIMHVTVNTVERRARHLKKLRLQLSIDSPRFAAVYDVGYTQGVHFAAVEHVRGADLRAVLRANGPLPMTTAANVLSQVATAIGTVHALELAYGSLQPNKVLVEKATIKLCDAGEAELLGNNSDLTRASGKGLDFVSPEILTGDEVTPACDVYSLGCLLYYAVTGKVPFPGGNADDKRQGHLGLYPLDPRRLAENLDKAFVDVMAAMMAKTPGERIQSAAEVVRRLEPWALATATGESAERNETSDDQAR
jgi:serine/threonine protein kinase